MKNIKWLLATIFIALVVYSNTAKADTHTVTTKQFVDTVASVPGKIGNHIKDEWAETKEYQADSWAEIKFKIKGLKEKFQAKQ